MLMTVKPTYEELEQKVKVLEELSTKSKQVEESLHDTAKLYHLLFDHAPDGVVIVDPATARFLDFNETACLLLGYSREEFSQLSIFDLEVAETPEETRSRIEYVIRHGISDFETRQRTKQGKIINLHITAQYTEILGKPVYHCIWRDITDHKLMESALKESGKRLADIIDFLPDATFAIDLSGKVIAWNRAIEEMTGVKAKDILGKGNHEYAMAFYGMRRPMLIDKVVGAAGTDDRKYDFVKRKGNVLLAEGDAILKGVTHFIGGKAGLLYDSHDNIVGAIESVRDITDRKLMELALKESERRLADIIDFLPDATFVIDLSGKVIAWNQAIEEMTGVKAEDILGKGNYEYTMAFYGMRRPMLIDMVFGFTEEIGNKYNFIKKEGNVLLAQAEVPAKGVHCTLWGKARPLHDSNGNIVGAIESVRDVTELKKAHDELEMRVRERTAEMERVNKALQKEISERKRTEAVLKESEEKYRQFFRTSRDFIFVTSKEGKIIDMNEAALELFGFVSNEELRQVKVPDLYVKPEEREGLYNTVLECGYASEFPADLRRKDGSIRHTLVTAVGCYDANDSLTGLQGTIRDVTEQRRNEEELRKYREKLESMVAERTRELEDKTKNLEEVNVTLNVLLQKREEDKNVMEERFVANIGSLVLPYVEKIKKNNLDVQQQFCLDTIEKNLDEITSPLLKNIRQFNLTPREIQIAYLIKDGKTTKEIAEALGIVEGSIATHRKNIRKKLALDRTSNLQSHLRFFEK